MGVYIKDMEMPVIELEWTIRRGADGKWYAIDTNAETSDGEWHEIVPVPAHGRLIDADALEETYPLLCDCSITEDGFVKWGEWGYSREQIRNAPTTIPASEEVEA